MSGVIDDDGVQWERCNQCIRWTPLHVLQYEKPSAAFPCGRDLCPRCAAQQPSDAIDPNPTILVVHKPTP
jgi:hypothetical protein